MVSLLLLLISPLPSPPPPPLSGTQTSLAGLLLLTSEKSLLEAPLGEDKDEGGDEEDEARERDENHRSMTSFEGGIAIGK
jgi:hypothetical protein